MVLSIICTYAESQENALQLDLNGSRVNGKALIKKDLNGLNVKSTAPGDGIIIHSPSLGQMLNTSKYLILEVEHNNPFTAVVNIAFLKSTGEKGSNEFRTAIDAYVSILPGVPTSLTFPVSYLDGQNIFLPRFPRQLKGTVWGTRTNPEEIDAIRISPGPSDGKNFQPSLMIRSAYLSNTLPAEQPALHQALADSMGQWKQKSWKGKTKNYQDLIDHRNELSKLENTLVSFPEEWSDWGGLKTTNFGATGFFRTHHDGRRWWLVDPEGFAFLSVGMDCVRPYATGVLEGIEDLYEWIPEGEQYAQARSESRNLKMLDFFTINMIRMFGAPWKEHWAIITRNKLVQMGFNTVGNWSEEQFARNSGIPWVLPLSGFPETEVKLYRDFPDVLSPEYRIRAVEFAAQLEKYKNDTSLIGYFLRNEPHWAFGDNDIAFEMFRTKTMSVAKIRFCEFIEKKYSGDLDGFMKDWNIKIPGFQAIKELTFIDYPSEKSVKDFREFTELLIDAYVRIPSTEARKVDPNHLNLGLRFAGIASPSLLKAASYFDVFSFNSYKIPHAASTAEIEKLSGKPVMIGEFHFGALDRGLPSTGLIGVKSQKERGKAYRVYVEEGFSRPEIVGIHYFQWLDQPVTGRFDGENFNIGFNDIMYREYPELSEAAKKTHLRIYSIAMGKISPYSKEAIQTKTVAH